jgi:hypothetical protein
MLSMERPTYVASTTIENQLGAARSQKWLAMLYILAMFCRMLS